MTRTKIEYHKGMCKIAKKYNNPNNKTLMQIQHEYAKTLGYKNWEELLKGEKE
jgi:hypothetical protein